MQEICNIVTIISTHTPLARRDQPVEKELYSQNISTHTPLARRDPTLQGQFVVVYYFYSHASREA